MYCMHSKQKSTTIWQLTSLFVCSFLYARHNDCIMYYASICAAYEQVSALQLVHHVDFNLAAQFTVNELTSDHV